MTLKEIDILLYTLLQKLLHQTKLTFQQTKPEYKFTTST